MTTKAQIEAVERLVRESVAHVEQMAPEAMRAVLPALRVARDELRQDLATWLRTVDNGANRFTAYEKTKALRSLESAIERAEQLHPAMSHALGLGRTAVGGVAVANLETEIVRLGHIFGDTVLSMPQIDTAAVIAQGNRLLWKRHEKSALRYAGNVGEDIKNLFAVGVAKHETFEQLVTRLRRIGGGRGVGVSPDAADDIAGGLFTRYKYWADRLVRTEMMHAYNVQHSDAIDRVNDLRPEGEEEYLRKWDASVDGAICPLCRALDKTVTTINGEFRGGVKNPPLHPHCRCVVLAWLRRWGDMKGEVATVGHVPETPKKEAAPEPPSRMPPPSKEPDHFPPATGSEAWAKEKASQNRSEAQRRRRDRDGSLPQESKPAKVAPMVKQPPAPPATPSEPDRTIPPGARVGQLRRAGLTESYQGPPSTYYPQGRPMYRLNDRGLAHFAAKRAADAKKKAGVGFGECQICSGQWAIVRGKISLHGYERPGYGWVEGRCRGAQELPFETSRDVLGLWIDTLHRMLKSAKAELLGIDERRSYLVEEYKRDAEGKRIYSQKNATYERQAVSIGPDDERFAGAKASYIVKLEGHIKGLEFDIDFQTKRFAAWKPRPLK